MKKMDSPSLRVPENSNHRKREGGESPDNERRKRGKYTQVACNECKRRKLKCSGGDVCTRCAANGMQCIYALQSRPPAGGDVPTSTLESPFMRLENMETRMSDMQRQMNFMSDQIRALQTKSQWPTSTPPGAAVSNHTDGRWASRGRPVSPSYIGPTSGEFGLHAVQPDAQEDETENSEDAFASGTASPHPQGQKHLRAIPSNPLLALTDVDALRLVDVYEDAVGMMYPIVDLKSIRRYIADYYHQRKTVSVDTLSTPQNGDEDWWFSARDAEILKIVLAIALISESHGRSDLGDALAANVEDTFASTRTQVPEVDMKELIILTLVALYHSLRDDDVLAWRTIGLAARGAMQLGLHRWDTWLRTGGVFPGDLERSWAINLFWCLYVFDKEFSFETGLPFAIRDSDMDSSLPEPVGYNPYLTCMISYCRVGSSIWDLVVGWGSTTRAVAAENCTYLDFQIKQWQDSIPREFRLNNKIDERGVSTRNNWLAVSQVLFHMRANQLGILVHKQNLLNSQSIHSNLDGARIAVDRARDTIQTLEKFSRTSAIYSHRPEPFNRFLFSALATLFLAVSHAPSRFTQLCRSEFYKALDTLKRSPTRGKYSRRLQKVIKNLKHINIRRRSHPPNREALYVATSGNRTPDQPSIADTSTPITPTVSTGINHTDYNTSMHSSLVNGDALDSNVYNDLTDFFELAGDCFMDSQSNIDPGVTSETELPANPSQQFQNSIDMFQAEDETLTRLMVGLL
ncbi:putative fungal-specific transcription factor [Talaromyces proteolyticus]|uniref:Fungal-specific transcription factor n=1 Tax=Talaromyces proteolyticus TaxID=1131652 RepID=A0AAD4KZQ8_9EURO|nr:putative fungal-specific transcription factor [Talaromyces proteolyticus]KAH8703598.1 putative fungal-specific transcription factor [Talaromyces proteolyticus]